MGTECGGFQDQDQCLRTTRLVWRSCQIGRLETLECLEAVFFDQLYELIAIFVIAFCLFLWILGPKTQSSMKQWYMRQAPAIVVMCTAAAAIFLFPSSLYQTPTTIPVWRSCHIGRLETLECLEAVFFDTLYELIAIFVIAFCLFLWILDPKTQSSMKQWYMRQAPDAVSQMRQVVGEKGCKKHVAHVLRPSFFLSLERPITGGGLFTFFSRSEGSLPLQSHKSARPIVKASFSRSTGSLVQQCQEPVHSHSRTTSNLRGVLQGKMLVLSHSPEGRPRRQVQATVYSSGTHFYKNVIAQQSSE